MATEKERVNKVESRAREAENALQKLQSYVLLLKKKSSKSLSVKMSSVSHFLLLYFAVDVTSSVSSNLLGGLGFCFR